MEHVMKIVVASSVIKRAYIKSTHFSIGTFVRVA